MKERRKKLTTSVVFRCCDVSGGPRLAYLQTRVGWWSVSMVLEVVVVIVGVDGCRSGVQVGRC